MVIKTHTQNCLTLGAAKQSNKQQRTLTNMCVVCGVDDGKRHCVWPLKLLLLLCLGRWIVALGQV